MQIRDDMRQRMNNRMTEDMREATRAELRGYYEDIVRQLDRVRVSDSFNRGAQAILLDMREIIGGA